MGEQGISISIESTQYSITPTLHYSKNFYAPLFSAIGLAINLLNKKVFCSKGQIYTSLNS